GQRGVALCNCFGCGGKGSAVLCALSLHDALPILGQGWIWCLGAVQRGIGGGGVVRTARADAIAEFNGLDVTGGRKIILHVRAPRSEEHTSELQSPCNLVCRLLLEKKKNQQSAIPS